MPGQFRSGRRTPPSVIRSPRLCPTRTPERYQEDAHHRPESRDSSGKQEADGKDESPSCGDGCPPEGTEEVCPRTQAGDDETDRPARDGIDGAYRHAVHSEEHAACESISDDSQDAEDDEAGRADSDPCRELKDTPG